MTRSLAALLLALGCGGGGDPLEDAQHIAGWANSSSAFGVYTMAHEPLAFANQAFSFNDPSCPATSDDGTTVVITGGCEDSEGRAWAGEVTVQRRDGGWDLDLHGFGDDRFGGMARTSGRFEFNELGETAYSFLAYLDRDGGIESHISYNGRVEGGYQGPTVWNGRGSVSRDGVVINSGEIDAETVDQVRDDELCPGEGVSGTTTMVSSAHTVVISYDGETDCDEDDAARWSLDGEDKGLVTGVTCSAGGPAGAGAALLVFLLAASLPRRRAFTTSQRRSWLNREDAKRAKVRARN